MTATNNNAVRDTDRANRIRAVADRLAVSPRQVWRLIEDGKLRADRLGPRCTRIFDSEIERFIAEQRGQAA